MNKTVLITGTDSGLGRVLVEVFTKNRWKVISASHDTLELRDQKSIDAFVATLNGIPLDVLINCAGVYDSLLADDEWAMAAISDITKVFQVNTIGTRFLTDALLPNLQKGKGKLVVTVSSIMSTYPQLDQYSAKHWPYSASKMALNYAMLAFGTEYPEIKSALIHPGWMKTKMGGKDAPLEPRVSAENIFNLITHHKKKTTKRETCRL